MELLRLTEYIRVPCPRWLMRCLVAYFLSAALLSGQALETLVGAYRKTPTAARRSALLRFAGAHSKDASGALALFTVGVTEVEEGNYEEGIRRLEAARPRLPALEDYVAFSLGSARYHQQDFAAAARELKVAWEFSPASPLAPEAVLLAARATVENGAPAEAVKILREHYSLLPQPAGDLLLASASNAAQQLPAAAEYFQRVYYKFPASLEAKQAGTALEGLRQAMGESYPPPMPGAMLGRADRLLDAGEPRRARAEYESLVSELGGAERELARIGVGVADYEQNLNRTAYRYLESLKLESDHADAKRLYYLVACARRLDDDAAMIDFVERLNRRHPRSEWRHKALVWAANKYLLVNDVDSYEPLYRACYESFPTGSLAAYCHWKVAWTAYIRRLPEAAGLLLEHLKTFPGGEKSSAALYFLGRLAEKAGDSRSARTYYSKILDHYPNYFYTALAEERLAHMNVLRPASSGAARQILETVEIPQRDLPQGFRPSPATRQRIARCRLLVSAGLEHLAERELRFAARNGGQRHILAMELARIASSQGAPDRAIRHLKGAFPEYLSLPFEAAPLEFWRLAFPLPYRKELERYCRRHDLDPFLMAGLIRQESEFNPKAVSRARARGLTQILPSTGRQLSRKLRLRYRISYLLRPDFNLRLGTYYFRTLLNQHQGELAATLAAYNGGKSRVDDWTTWGTFDEQAEFIETIPITETRDYVQSVFRNAAMYRKLYGGESAEVTSADGSSARRRAAQ